MSQAELLRLKYAYISNFKRILTWIIQFVTQEELEDITQRDLESKGLFLTPVYSDDIQEIGLQIPSASNQTFMPFLSRELNFWDF